MSLILTLDQMGKRYGLLPSEVIDRASTFDLVIMDAALGYIREMERQSKPGYVPQYKLEDIVKLHEEHK